MKLHKRYQCVRRDPIKNGSLHENQQRETKSGLMEGEKRENFEDEKEVL
jgi:hypothetical protein